MCPRQAGTVHCPHQSVRQETIRDCKKQSKTQGKADGILLNSDVAFSGTEAPFDRSAEWIEELAAAAGCSHQADVRVILHQHSATISGGAPPPSHSPSTFTKVSNA